MPANFENRIRSRWPRDLLEASEESNQDAWTEKMHDLEGRVEHKMAEYPKMTLIAAALLGVIVGWMIKRR